MYVPSEIPFYSANESRKFITGKWKLTGPSYKVWKVHFRSYLKAQNLLYVIDEVPKGQPGQDAQDDELDAYYQNLADESQVMSILILTSLSELTDNLRKKPCYEFVQYLEETFKDSTEDSKQFILQEIISSKMKDDQPLSDHLINIRRLLDCLTLVTGTSNEHEQVLFLFGSLTQYYQDKVVRIVGNFDLSVAGLHENLLCIRDVKRLEEESLPEIQEDEFQEWLNDFADLCCPACGNKDICEHTSGVGLLDADFVSDSGI